MEQIQNPQQAVGLLIQAVQLAQKSGVYELKDAALLAQAVDFLTQQNPEPQLEVVDENEETTEE